MNIYLGQSLLLRHLKQSVEMLDVRMYTTVRKKSPQMQVRIILLAVVHSCKQSLILEEIAILDCLCNSGQILINNTAGTDVHMSNLRVSHLSIRKTNSKSGSSAFNKRALLHQFIHYRSICHRNRITLCAVIETITVKYH